jgi:hypothetical protein
MPDFEPPGTWEEVAALPPAEKIRAARVFLRRAAIRLHEDAKMDLVDVANAFTSVPQWISAQKHEHKRANAPGVRFKCDECGHQDLKTRFFITVDEPWLPTCPECGANNASRLEPEEKKVEPLKLKHVEVCRICSGSKCPVCEIGEMVSHTCTHCHTVLCSRCHKIKETQCSRAYDTVSKCRCEEKSDVDGHATQRP